MGGKGLMGGEGGRRVIVDVEELFQRNWKRTSIY